MRRLRSNHRPVSILLALLGLAPAACMRFGYDLLDDGDDSGAPTSGETTFGSGSDGQAGAPSDGSSSGGSKAVTSCGGATTSTTGGAPSNGATASGGTSGTTDSGGLGGSSGSTASTSDGNAGSGGTTTSGSGAVGGNPGSGGMGGSTTTGGGSGACNPPVDLFPVPVNDTTSLFPEVDDAFLNVPFDLGFSFPFYGTDYDALFLNTNGGLTFGEGDDFFTPDVTFHDAPSIAVFWGDMAADSNGAENRVGQLSYQQCENQFIVEYNQLQHWLEADWTSTATLTLYADGTIRVDYGDVTAQEILVGIFDGSHSQDQTVPLQTTYPSYGSVGSGIILFDDPVGGGGTLHTGELSAHSLVYSP